MAALLLLGLASASPIAAVASGDLPEGSRPSQVGERYAVTEFYYWYDPATGSHMEEEWMTLHLPNGRLPDNRDPGWFKWEFKGMMRAGIDIFVASYWAGEPWSWKRLRHMRTALDGLADKGKDPPGAGMFFETGPLAWKDLTEPEAQDFMFEHVERFFSKIPQEHWGLIEGRPVIWFWGVYPGIFDYDQSTFDSLYARFTERFGVRPFIVADRAWVAEKPIEIDATHTWGVAYAGFQPRDFDVAGAGPGCDDSNLPGRLPTVVPREDGAWYRRNLYYALSSGANILWLETWNEHHEATNINETEEYGKEYIDITREHVDLYKQGLVPPKPPGGPYEDATVATATFPGEDATWEGLEMLDNVNGGEWAPIEIGGRSARITSTEGDGRFLYFDIDDDFAYFDEPVTVTVTLSFFAYEGGHLVLEYDSFEPGVEATLEHSFRPVSLGPIGYSQLWRTASVTLEDVRFSNGQHGLADFRVSASAPIDLIMDEVTITKP